MVFFSRKRDVVNRGHFIGIIVLTLANAAVALRGDLAGAGSSPSRSGAASAMPERSWRSVPPR
jgi:hypothetical protein